MTEIVEIPFDVLGLSAEDLNARLAEDTQEIIEVTGIRIEGLRTFLPFRIRFDEGTSRRMVCNVRIVLPNNRPHQ
jgi:hypothetical protein